MRHLMIAIGVVSAVLANAWAKDGADDVTAAIDQQIATKGVAAEAEDFIPDQWRPRIRALRTVRLDEDCVELREIAGTPSTAREQAFVFQCQSVPWYALGGEDVLHWMSADTLEQANATTLSHLFWRGDIAVRGGEAFAYFQSPARVTLLSRDGEATDLPGSSRVDPGAHRDLSPSGRLSLRLRFPTEFVVLDLADNSLEFRTSANAPYYLVRERSDGTVQLVGSDIHRDCQATSCPPGIIVLDAATNQVTHIPIPNGVGSTVPRSYGARQVVVTTEPAERGEARGVAIVDLDRLEVVWSGPVPDAPPAFTYMCGPLEFEGDTRDLTLPLHVSLHGVGFVLRVSERRAPTRCAVTGDGRRLAVVAPPFVHFYAVEPD